MGLLDLLGGGSAMGENATPDDIKRYLMMAGVMRGLGAGLSNAGPSRMPRSIFQAMGDSIGGYAAGQEEGAGVLGQLGHNRLSDMQGKKYAAEAERQKAWADPNNPMLASLPPEQRALIQGMDPERGAQSLFNSQQQRERFDYERGARMDDYKARLAEAHAMRPPAAPSAPQEAPGGFKGTGMDQQAWNIVMRGQTESPEYAAAWAHLSQPKMQMVPDPNNPGQMQMGYITPSLPFPPPGKRAEGGPAPIGAEVPGAAQPPMGGASAQPQVPGMPTVTPIPGTTKPAQMTAEQSKDATFADRMLQSENELQQFDRQGANFWGRLKEAAPGGIGNYLQTDEYQRFEQSRRNFINAQLRRESGAVISDAEFLNADKQYFPRPGDSDAVIEQKRRNRDAAIKGMIRSSGPAYRPPVNPSTIQNGQTTAAPDESGSPGARGKFAMPTVGEIRDKDGKRYRYKGGDPASPDSWETLAGMTRIR